MITAVVFDLDGTLLNSEYLKSISYAEAIKQLSGGSIDEEDVHEAFRGVVGRSRREVCDFLIERFKLESLLTDKAPVYGVREGWEVLAKVRLSIYDRIIEDPNLLYEHRWPHSINLLRQASEGACKLGLATMSSRDTALRVLDVLGIRLYFDVIVTVEEARRTKPSPDIYLTACERLGVPPTDALAVEDSPSGVRSAIAAGMHVVAVSTPFTHDGLMELKELDRRWLAQSPDELPAVVNRILEFASPGRKGAAPFCGI